MTHRGRAVKEVSVQGDQPRVGGRRQTMLSVEVRGSQEESSSVGWVGRGTCQASFRCVSWGLPLQVFVNENYHPVSPTGQKLFLKGWMTSVRRQFKTSQGSEKGGKKRPTGPGQLLTYKAKGRNSESRRQECKAATQTAELGDFQSQALLSKSSCLCYSWETFLPEHL